MTLYLASAFWKVERMGTGMVGSPSRGQRGRGRAGGGSFEGWAGTLVAQDHNCMIFTDEGEQMSTRVVPIWTTESRRVPHGLKGVVSVLLQQDVDRLVRVQRGEERLCGALQWSR